MNLQQLKQAVETNGGATLTSNLENAALDSWYMVSLQDYEMKTSIEALSSEMLEDYKQLAERENAFIGLWLDADDLYIDISVNVHTELEAFELAHENNQIAIYQIETGESIYV